MVNPDKIIINSIVFKKELDQGVSQLDLLKKIAQIGLRCFEVRREFLHNGEEELKAMKEMADALKLTLFYSVNEDLLCHHQLNPELEQLLQEAIVLGAPFIKLNIGDASKVSFHQLEQLRQLMDKTLPIKVENNQDPIGASLKNCHHFMTRIKEARLPISFVFDTANWIFVGESLTEAVSLMKESTDYLHCKNYEMSNHLPGLSEGLFKGEIKVKHLLSEFTNLSYLALEYPTDTASLLMDIAEITDER
ncbi:sugar phosphate isomerase/epimerase family protein [Streptococcus iniae]|uniref:AP endonuclease n=1 Tax=Streptococcus iniae TaxID=1346 RepID=A0A3L8GAD8_STRIN|nr:hypothetical protein [Streptococcus iniae]AGM99768.1 AP endonuclease, family 2 [Streptococcus iniae SF1]AJG26799.1 AP endonuclease [Streptococcus iniae]APD32696.1 AP endonuclease [Streptococcus iniae]ASL35664.1 xylose isomerase-like TIM barrel [Streptococcus iniae]ATX38654.1 hypothetical protein CTW00_00412 [Streptococcus iniae]